MKKFLFALTISLFFLFFVKVDSFAYSDLTINFADGSSVSGWFVDVFAENGFFIQEPTTGFIYFCVPSILPEYSDYTNVIGNINGGALRNNFVSWNNGDFYFCTTWSISSVSSSIVSISNGMPFYFLTVVDTLPKSSFDDSLDIFGFRVRKITGKLDLSNDNQPSLVSPWCMAWWDSVSDNVDHVVMTFYNTDTGDVVINPASNYYSFLLGTYISGGAMTVGVTPYDSAGNYGYTSYAEVGYLFQSVDDPIGYDTDYTLDGEPVDVIGKDPQVVYKTTFVPTSGSPSGGTVIYEGDTYIYKTPPASDPSSDNPNPTPPVPSTGAPTTPVPTGYKFDWPDASDKDKVFTGVKDFFTGFGDGFGSIVSLLLLIFPMLGPVGAVLIFCMGLILEFGAIIILIKIIGTIL